MPAHRRYNKVQGSILRRIYNLSFDQIEYQINDRLSFMRFLGIGLNEQVLDSRTIWDFEDKLARAELIVRCSSCLMKNWRKKDLSHIKEQ